MKNVVGNPARGENFFQRDMEISKLIDRLEAGNNIQIAAPRRVGKTSILHYLRDNGIGGSIYIYVDTEAVVKADDFFKKILQAIVCTEAVSKSARLKKLWEAGVKALHKIKSITILGNSLDFTEPSGEVDHYEELSNFLQGMALEGDKPLVLLIDEFPQTIVNIVEANKGETGEAIQFLQANRELRLHPDISPKVRFVYTGSIGLNHTVAAINASAFVNDLNAVEVLPLTGQEAAELLHQLLANRGLTIEDQILASLLHKIGWLIPFHLQLAVQEISSLKAKGGPVNASDIEQAFDNMVAARNLSHFEHYHSRLRSQFKGAAFAYAEAVLQTIATKGNISTGELYNEAVGYDVQNQYRQILGALAYDGYINNNGDHHSYQFNSPLVRLWWQKFICN